MNIPRTIPYATLTLAFMITVVQVLRMSGGIYEDLVFPNLHHGNWDVFYSQPWRMITSPFIHQNLLHYLENLVFLLLFGFQIERAHGWKYVLGPFFGALVTGYVIFLTFMHGGIIGISGGVCGLFGCSLIANRRTPWWTTLTHRPLHILYSLNLLASVIADVTDLVPFGVAHVNHIVGILHGLLIGSAFLLTSSGLRWRAAAVALPVLLFASQFYSPWQIEWQLVQKQERLLVENPDCQLRSIEYDPDTPSLIFIMNESTSPVAYYWLDYKGRARFILWVESGNTGEVYAYVGQPACIVNADTGKLLQVVQPTNSEQTVTIR